MVRRENDDKLLISLFIKVILLFIMFSECFFFLLFILFFNVNVCFLIIVRGVFKLWDKLVIKFFWIFFFLCFFSLLFFSFLIIWLNEYFICFNLLFCLIVINFGMLLLFCFFIWFFREINFFCIFVKNIYELNINSE